MNITVDNKDHIARLIAEKAHTLPVGGNNDMLCNDLLRVSEALERVGEIGSNFRSLKDFHKINLPPTMDENKHVFIERDRTYFQALVVGVKLIAEEAA